MSLYLAYLAKLLWHSLTITSCDVIITIMTVGNASSRGWCIVTEVTCYHGHRCYVRFSYLTELSCQQDGRQSAPPSPFSIVNTDKEADCCDLFKIDCFISTDVTAVVIRRCIHHTHMQSSEYMTLLPTVCNSKFILLSNFILLSSV